MQPLLAPSPLRSRYYTALSMSKRATTSNEINLLDYDAIQVTPIQNGADLIALADLRYQEWILTADGKATTPTPSRQAFRMATAELQQERMAQNAVVFLARCGLPPQQSAVMGSAELSAIELEGCLLSTTASLPSSDHHPCYYVTDVVTASAYRRRGVAAKLMLVLENYAVSSSRWAESKKDDSPTTHTATLLLHVEPTNKAALAFYSRMGYQIILSKDLTTPTIEESLNIDTKRLAENAGVSGQLLLRKVVQGCSVSLPPDQGRGSKSAAFARGGGGFGNSSKAISRPRKNKRKAR